MTFTIKLLGGPATRSIIGTSLFGVVYFTKGTLNPKP